MVLDPSTRELPWLSDRLDELIRALVQGGALGLLAIDAGVLGDIQRRHGAAAVRDALAVLIESLLPTLCEVLGPEPLLMGQALEPERLLVFLPKPRSDKSFYTRSLPRLEEKLREHVSVAVQRIAYPYLTGIFDIPVGAAVVLHRPFHQPESEIQHLLRSALDAGRFAAERMRRERGGLLERLILEESLSTVYEPIVSLSHRQTIGYEALSRGPGGGPLASPMVCFNIAQRCGLDFELDTVCRRLALRNARGLREDELLFLNILPSSVHDLDFSETGMLRSLDELGISPGQIVFEISERQTIGNYTRFREAVHAMVELGCRIAVDDVGSGYSNLETAIELSPDFLKVDRTLIHQIHDDPQKQEILRGLVRLGQKMKAAIIAEGIESEDERTALRQLGVGYGQGYAIGRGRSSLTKRASERAASERAS